MTGQQEIPTPSPLGPLARYERNLTERITNFNDPPQGSPDRQGLGSPKQDDLSA